MLFTSQKCFLQLSIFDWNDKMEDRQTFVVDWEVEELLADAFEYFLFAAGNDLSARERE